MKTLLVSVFLIISALLLIGASVHAQSKDADRDWVDSLAVKYRTAFIQSDMVHDQTTLNSMGASVFALIFNLWDHRGIEPEGINAIMRAVHRYDAERQSVQIRKTAYRKEMLAARSDFSAL